MKGSLKKLLDFIVSAIEFISSGKFYTLVIGHLIIVGLLLFTSKLLGIDTLHYAAKLKTDAGGILVFPDREVGYFWAINWTFYFTIIMTAYIILFHLVVNAVKEFCQKVYAKKMIVYKTDEDLMYRLRSEQIWESVLKTSSHWVLVVFCISISLGLVQWYQYSGQWYFSGFDLGRFLTVSTGVDWNVAGSIASLNNGHGLLITIFALINYLYYGVGWALMFSFYIVLITFFVELYRLSKAKSNEGNSYLVADSADQENAGFKSFGTIQAYHAIFSLISILSLYLMSLRNNYLPHQCRVPTLLQNSPDKYDHCRHLLDLIFISKDLLKPIIASGTGAIGRLPAIFDALFFNYVSQNTWTLGPFYNIAFICAFFLIISMLMKNVILISVDGMNHEKEDLASGILNRLKSTKNKTLLLFILGGVGALFTNVGSLMIIGLILWPVKIFIDYTKKNYLNIKKLESWLKELFGL